MARARRDVQRPTAAEEVLEVKERELGGFYLAHPSTVNEDIAYIRGVSLGAPGHEPFICILLYFRRQTGNV